jgi:hypothetical protein
MIMGFTQRFALNQGEWACRGCGVMMTERAEDSEVVMNHRDDCPEVSGARPAGA